MSYGAVGLGLGALGGLGWAGAAEAKRRWSGEKSIGLNGLLKRVLLGGAAGAGLGGLTGLSVNEHAMRPAGPSFADQAIQLDAREHQHAYDRAESNGQVKTFSAAPALLKAGQGAAGAAIRLGPELVTLAEKTPAALEAAAEATPKLWNATQAAALKAWPTLKWMVGVGAPAAQGASQLQSGVQGYVDASQKGMPAVARANLQAGAVGAASNATLATLGAGALAPALSQARLLRVLAGLRMSGQLLPQLGRIGAPALPGLAATAALVGSARADRGLELNAPGPAYQRLLASGPAPQLSPVQQSFADRLLGIPTPIVEGAAATPATRQLPASAPASGGLSGMQRGLLIGGGLTAGGLAAAAMLRNHFRRNVAQKKAQVSDPTLDDLLDAINKDPGLDFSQRTSLVSQVQSAMGNEPGSTPVRTLMYRGMGGVIGWLITKYFGAGPIGQTIGALAGMGVGNWMGTPAPKSQHVGFTNLWEAG